MSFNFSITLLLGGCLLVSCQNDKPANGQTKPEYQKNELIGRWELLRGFRSGKETETLTGTYYEFTEETLKTNLTPTTIETSYKYAYSDNEIKQKGDIPLVYTVDTLTTELLTLSVNINNFPFKLELKKVQNDSISTTIDTISL